MTFIHIAFYKFVPLETPAVQQEALLKLCNDLQLKGTILLAHEGINGCLVGTPDHIQAVQLALQNMPEFADLDIKESQTSHVPYRRMLVKVKKEIIPMGIPEVKPMVETGQRLDALDLKRWLENNEDIILLDTRNDYEVEIGTFRNAINPNLKEFRQFPQWIKDNFQDHKKKKIVTFCTGGIRCEKATAFMLKEGFEQVYQLQGGILRYLEATSRGAEKETDNHYDGSCFVFDYRVAVDKNLVETSHNICYNCWNVLTLEDLESEHYKKDVHCPHCKDRYLERQKKRQMVMADNNKKALEVRLARAKAIREQRGVGTEHP